MSKMNGRCIPHTNSAISLFCEQLQNWQKYDAPISIWMMLGTNDLLQNPSFLAEDIADRMQYFLSQTTSFLKERKLYEQFHFSLIAPVLLQYGAWVEDSHMIRESRRLSAQYKKVADSLGIHFIDMGSEEIPVLFDGVHLSEEGHRNFAEKRLTFL